MPPDRRLLRDIASMNRGIADYQLQAGQWVQWFRFNAAASTSDPTYSTGPQRVWYSPVTIPVVIGEFERAEQNFDDGGLYVVNNLHLVVSYSSFFGSTIPNPDPSGLNHLNDRVAFDGTLFNVNQFQPRGRVASTFLTISVQLEEVSAEDMAEDVPAAMFAPYFTAS